MEYYTPGKVNQLLYKVTNEFFWNVERKKQICHFHKAQKQTKVSIYFWGYIDIDPHIDFFSKDFLFK